MQRSAQLTCTPFAIERRCDRDRVGIRLDDRTQQRVERTDAPQASLGHVAARELACTHQRLQLRNRDLDRGRRDGGGSGRLEKREHSARHQRRTCCQSPAHK